jgi:hypothetical protein
MTEQLKNFYLTTLYSSHWYLGKNMTSYLEMATVREKAMSVIRFYESKSDNNLESFCISYSHTQSIPGIKFIKYLF